MPDDRQTDHATEKCIRIGGIACDVRALPSNNSSSQSGVTRIIVNLISDVIG